MGHVALMHHGVGLSRLCHTGETPNYMMLARELRVPDQLVCGRLEPEHQCREECVLQLSQAMQKAHKKLRDRQEKLRTDDSQEPLLFQVIRFGFSVKGPTTMSCCQNLQVDENHTDLIEWNGKVSKESENQLKTYVLSASWAGKAPRFKEPNCQRSQQDMILGQKCRRPEMTDVRYMLEERTGFQRQRDSTIHGQRSSD